MSPAEAARVARQLVALVHCANDGMSDLLDHAALDRASTLVELAAELGGRLQVHLDAVALQDARLVDGEASAS